MTYTWKIIYYPTADKMSGGYRGVALVEAASRAEAMYYFQDHYSGQYHTVASCEKLLG